MQYLYALAGLAGFVVVVLPRARRNRKQELPPNHPPIVHISPEDIYGDRRKAYEKALREHGPVIGVPRRGLLEFIVEDRFIPMIFTSSSFSFEEAATTSLNLRAFVSVFSSFFRDMDDVVQGGVNPRLNAILESTSPIFFRSVDKALKPGKDTRVEMFHFVSATVARVMMQVIFGEPAKESTVNLIVKIAEDFSIMTGVYLPLSPFGRRFPTLWAAFTWIKALCTTIPRFFFTFGPALWRHLRGRKWIKNQDTAVPASVLEYLAFKHAREDGTISRGGFMWILSIVQTLVFASVHQTASVAAWVMFEIAKRPEYLEKLRTEAFSLADPVTHEFEPSSINETLQKAVLLDAFIREVLRTKGDMLTVCRRTMEDVQIGGCTVPKGHLVFPLATLAHFNPASQPGPDPPEVFKPERWMGANPRPAVMTGPSYLVFGFGKWACPGRVLAIADIKLMVWAIITKTTPRPEDEAYRLTELLHQASIPPLGGMILQPWEKK
ncbi:hypothetical protein MKEN_01247500 [Mycena kentingensis (nom. inval.)]|nr:hypothetical protein MKEN_01247500 [Mycena kentingensis (nom. inval.)]